MTKRRKPPSIQIEYRFVAAGHIFSYLRKQLTSSQSSNTKPHSLPSSQDKYYKMDRPESTMAQYKDVELHKNNNIGFT